MEAAGDLILDFGSPAWIVRTLRDRGMRIPRYVWQSGEQSAPIGLLEIDWTVSKKHRRQIHVARLLAAGKDLLPCIRDVHIVRLTSANLTLTGFEQIEDREYAQTWFCRLARTGWAERGKPDDPTGSSND